jgi:GNAT superfamily N-acetyltransferase
LTLLISAFFSANIGNFRGKDYSFFTFVAIQFLIMAISVRKGFKEDLRHILRLIKELAVYEKAADEVTITIQDLERDGFGENAIFRFVIAEENKEVLGMALFYTKYSTWKGRCLFLEDIIVSEQHRKKGIGKLLFEQVISEAKEAKAKRIEWQVLDWNTPAIKFYEKYNAVFMNEWISCRLTEDQIKKL